MPVVIHEFEVVPEPPRQEQNNNAPAPDHAATSDPRDLEQFLRERQARLSRLRAD